MMDNSFGGQLFNEEIRKTYDIIEEIGEGGSGTVYKAYHKRLDKYVVLKKIHNRIRKLLDAKTETNILKNLHHPFLPQVLDFIETEDAVYTVMDFVSGQSFAQLVEMGKTFSPTQVLKYTEQLCEVVSYLHEQSPPIIHGDIKPANLMLTLEDNICLIDFNISGFLDGSVIAVGYTAGYAAPEQRQAVRSQTESLFPSVVEDEETVLLDEDDATLLLDDDADKTDIISEEDESGRHSLSENESSPNKHIVSGEADHSNKQFIKNDKKAIDRSADVYSIGATIYHIALNVKPHMSPAENPAIENVSELYSSGFSAIISKAMEELPEHRFRTASDMLKAVKNIYKYDKKYKRLLLKQEIVYIILFCLIGISVFMVIRGRQKITQENISAYYEEAYSLTEQGSYEEVIEYINENLMSLERSWGDDLAGDVYYLMANAYFEMEDYQKAIVYYQAAINEDDQVSKYYGDYAVALVYCGRIDNAEEVLKQGRETGLASDYIYLISAEIESRQGRYEEAAGHFEECIRATEDRRVKLRAYIMWDKMLKARDKTEETLARSISLLSAARTDVELTDQLLILEMLAQDYIDLSTVTSDTSYDEKALDILRDIVRSGWDNYTTHVNIAVLYQKNGYLDEAETELKQLMENEPDNYIAYKRLAFLELDIQSKKPGAERTYELFNEYYLKAFELYKNSDVEGNDDVEMQLLEQTYMQQGGMR